jgi:hypothetical protein
MRVNSKKAAQFRRAATKVLKQRLLRGYAINTARLGNDEAAPLEWDGACGRLDRRGEHAKSWGGHVGP